MMATAKPTKGHQAGRRRIRVLLASPRGFCAGVERAVRAVEEALARHGAPVFVRHEIVHNAHVVRRLREMGAVFVEDVADAPSDRPLVLSAHGSPQQVYSEAADRGIDVIDATCPLVSKVHSEARRHIDRGRHVLLIGHSGHAEVLGTLGQAPAGAMTVVETAEQAATMLLPSMPLAYVTQTTLSVDDTGGIVSALQARRPDILGPATADICYATTNRQAAVKAIAPSSDLLLVVGSPGSSNSRRLVETAATAGARRSMLVEDPSAFDLSLIADVETVGVTSGASAPEDLVEDLLARLATVATLCIETVEVIVENVTFKQPPTSQMPAPQLSPSQSQPSAG